MAKTAPQLYNSDVLWFKKLSSSFVATHTELLKAALFAFHDLIWYRLINYILCARPACDESIWQSAELVK